MRGQIKSKLIVFATFFTSLANVSFAQQCEPRWADNLFVHPGTSGVRSLAVWNDGTWPALFVGGTGTTAQNVVINRIGKWDGIAWSNLDVGLSYGEANAILPYQDGLIVAGGFNTAGGEWVNEIARWDGVHWTGLGAGLGDYYVNALTIFEGDLIVAGHFTEAGKVTANRIARWDGREWHALGNGVNDIANALTIWNGQLVVAGRFTMAGNGPANRVALWDGQQWSALPAGIGDSTVRALAVFEGKLILGGSFTMAGEMNTPYLATWDGEQWGTLGEPLDHGVNTLLVDNQALYIGGDFLFSGETQLNRVARWDGDQWAPIGGGVDGRVYAIAQFDDDVFVGGDFGMAGETIASGIARWNGATWNTLGPRRGKPMATVTELVDHEGGLLAISGYNNPPHRFSKWDGTTLSAVDFPILYGGIGNAKVYDGKLVVTRWHTGFEFPEPGYIVQWDGKDWAPLGGGVDHECYPLTEFDGNLIAGGRFVHADGIEVNHIASWNGEDWASIGDGLEGIAIGSIVANGNELYASGNIGPPSEWELRVVRWNGLAWDYLGPPFDGGAFLAVAGNHLYAGGDFEEIGNEPFNRVAIWNGESWEQLSSGLGGESFDDKVFWLTSYEEKLVAGGKFRLAGEVEVNGIATWDGSNWLPFGTGLDATARVLYVHDDGLGPEPALYVGGSFQQAGGHASISLARWGCLYDKADFDHNLIVDLADFAVFSPCLLGLEATPMETCREADLFRDERVELRDLAFFQRSFGETQ